MDLVRGIELLISIVAFTRETNKSVCKYVLWGGLETVERQKLSREY
jgi:hypothetical protein